MSLPGASGERNGSRSWNLTPRPPRPSQQQAIQDRHRRPGCHPPPSVERRQPQGGQPVEQLPAHRGRDVRVPRLDRAILVTHPLIHKLRRRAQLLHQRLVRVPETVRGQPLGDHSAAIRRLRALLREDPDPIDRHFMFCELEERLYRSRDAFSSALDDYDEACALHDAEMDVIRDALLQKFGKVPLLETYRQMAVRQQKAKNWAEALRWVERGLTLYGSDAARPEAVEDLRKRVSAYTAKLAGARELPVRAVPVAPKQVDRSGIETLKCESCGAQFERMITRGRKRRTCPTCRS